MEPDILIIDGNKVAHANDHTRELSVGDLNTQAIYGTLRSLEALAKKYPKAKMIVAWDGRAQGRFDLYPKYKSNRNDVTNVEQQARREMYARQMPYLRKAIKLLGITQMIVPHAEADDIAGYLVKNLSSKRKILLMTGDTDWLQLINANVAWSDTTLGKYVDKSSFFDATGFETPQAFLEGKALIGDTSDCIEGIPKIGPKKGALILAKFKSVENFFAKIDSGEYSPDNSTTGTKSVEHTLASPNGRDIFRRNMKLMNLIDTPYIAHGDIKTTPGALNKEKLEELFIELNFNSILLNLDGFARTFDGNRI